MFQRLVPRPLGIRFKPEAGGGTGTGAGVGEGSGEGDEDEDEESSPEALTEDRSPRRGFEQEKKKTVRDISSERLVFRFMGRPFRHMVPSGAFAPAGMTYAAA